MVFNTTFSAIFQLYRQFYRKPEYSDTDKLYHIVLITSCPSGIQTRNVSYKYKVIELILIVSMGET